MHIPVRVFLQGVIQGGLTIDFRWVAFENKSKCFYVLGMSQVWVFVLLFVSKKSSVECFMPHVY